MRLRKELKELSEKCKNIRGDLHKIPELAFEEFETQKYIMKTLEAFSPDKLEKIAGTGVKAVFYAKEPTETIAFRADMDALTMRDGDSPSQKSFQNPGKMHACGHDGHMTTLLLLAEIISKNRTKLKQNVVLLFQPGEEGAGGARRMIEGGALQNPSVDRIYGAHVWPSIPEGKIGLRWNVMMAQTLEFDIIIHGVSAHAASPQMGIDAVVIAAELILMLQTVITRSLDPNNEALLTIGRIEGGAARNVIADKVVLYSTLRVLDPMVQEKIMERIRDMLRGLSIATGASFEIKELMHYPCVNNPRPLVENFYRYVDMTDLVLIPPAMAAEDFACYQELVPGMFMFLGIGRNDDTVPLHNSEFDFNEAALLFGVEAYLRLLEIEE